IVVIKHQQLQLELRRSHVQGAVTSMIRQREARPLQLEQTAEETHINHLDRLIKAELVADTRLADNPPTGITGRQPLATPTLQLEQTAEENQVKHLSRVSNARLVDDSRPADSPPTGITGRQPNATATIQHVVGSLGKNTNPFDTTALTAIQKCREQLQRHFPL